MHPFQKSTLIGYSFFSERGVIDMLRLSMSEINQAKFRNAIRKALEIQIFSLNFVPFVVSEECEQLTLMITCLISMGTLTLDAAYTICDSTSDLMIKAFPNNVKFLAFHTSSFF